MKRLLHYFALISSALFISVISHAQSVGINGTGAAPNASAMLDVSSTTSGMLVPRMTQTQRNSISSPATGLLIYQTDFIAGFYYFDGTIWRWMGGSSGWLITGNSGTTSATNFIGTTDANDLVFKTNGSENMRLANTTGNLILGSGDGTGAVNGNTLRAPNAAGLNITGADMTIMSGNGTGIGGSGNLIFESAPSGATGSTVNTMTQRMLINQAGNIIIGSGEGTNVVIGNTLRAPSALGINIAGADLTVTPGNGTGTGGSGNLIFESAPAGATGATANTMTERMRLTSTGALAFGGAANYGSAGQVLISNGNSAPTWGTINSSLATSSVMTSTSGVSIVNGSGQVVGGSNLTINIATNSSSSPGLVTAGSGNNNKVWGTDGSGNPSWATANSALTTNNIAPVAGSAVKVTNGTGQVVGGSNVSLDVQGTNGGVFYGTGAGISATFTAAGSNGQVMTVNGSGIPVWTTATYPTTTTANQLLFSSATNTVTGLAAGTNGQVLSMVGGVPTWAAASASLANLTPGTGLTGSVYNGSTAQTFAVAYGSTAGTAVQGNTTLTITPGTGMSGGGTITLGAGGTITLNNTGLLTANNGLSVSGGNNVQFGGTLIQTTTITHANFDLIHNLTGAGNFRVQSSSVDALQVLSSTGNVVVGWGEASTTPTGNTLRAPNAAGSNITGANFTLNPGNGTGTGGSGYVTIQTAPAGATGTTANTLTEALRVTNIGNVIIGSGELTGAPVGNTLRSPSGWGVNITGSNMTITPGNGTGSGGSGSLIFQTAPIAATGGTANTMVERMRLTATGALAFSGAANYGTSGSMLQSNGNSTPAWSTATYPTTTTANQLLYSSATNTVNGLAAGTNGQVLSIVGGVPTWSSANSSLTTKNVTTSTTGVTIGNGTGQVVGASNLTVDVATNSSASPGLVTAGSGNNNKVWGTDGSGNPSWTTANSALTTNNIAPAAGSSVKVTNGAGQVVGGSNVSLDVQGTNGGVFYGTGVGTSATFTAAGSTGQIMTVNGSNIPVWTTATYPTTTTTNQLLYSSATNVVTGLAAGTNGQVLSMVGGVPTWASASASLANLTPGTGLTGSVYNGSTAQTFAVNYGSTAGSAVQGNTTLTITPGTGMSGGGTITLGAGGTVTLNNTGLLTANNGLSISGGNNVQLGGTLIQTTTITHANFDLIHNLSGTGNFRVQNSGSDALEVLSSTGNVVIGSGDFTATVVGNTLRAPNAAGTNIPGANFTLNGGDGTGTGGSGYVSIQIAPAGVTGAAANALTEALRIANNGNIIIGSGEGTAAVNGNTLRTPSAVGNNIPGSNFIITAGDGTGTGGSGNLIFQSAPVAATGTTSNTMTERMRLTNTGALAFSGATNYGVSGSILQSNGNSTPAWTTATYPTTTTIYQLLYSSAPNTVSGLAVGTNGQVLSIVGGVPTWASASASLANLTPGTGLTGSAYNGSTAQTFAVNYGSTAGSAVQGNTTLTITPGTGMSGGGTITLGSGGTVTLNNTGVTSVGLSLPSIFTVTNSPVTTTGTLTGSFTTETANTVFAGPASGVAAVPTFRALVSADIPAGVVTANNGLNISGGNNVQLGGTLIQTTTITQGNFDLISNMSGTGNFRVQKSAADALEVMSATGNVVIGSGEATAVVAGNTLRAPNATGTNIAGANMTITPGNGTGTGGSGNLIFQTAPTAATGTTANTMTERMRLTTTGALAFSGAANYGTSGSMLQSTGNSTPAWSIATYPTTTTANQLLYSSATNTVTGLAAGTNGQVLTMVGGIPTWGAATGNYWSITGNGGTVPGTNFLGTTDPNDLVFETNSSENMRIANSSGNVVIGNGEGGSAVGNTIRAPYNNSGGNRTGADLTIASGAPTGKGGSGNIIFQTLAANVGSPGNTSDLSIMAEDMRITSTGALAFNGAANYGTSGSMLQSTGNGIPTWSTATYPTTTTANQLLYSSATNTVTGLTTGTNGQFLIISGGVPTWSSIPAGTVTANNGLTVNTGNNVQLGGTLIQTTTITHAAYDLIHNLSGTGNFRVQNSGTDAFSVRNGTGNVVIGSGEATAVVAGNTLRGPNATGTNIAGANMTITPGDGTGTGGSGNLIFQTAPTAATGATANTMTERMRLTTTGALAFSGAANYGTSGSMLQSTGNSTPAWSTATYPTTTTANQLLYSSATNTVTGLAVGTNGQVLTMVGGIPTWGAATGNYWSITGNSGTTAGTNFIGTTDATDFEIKTGVGPTERMHFVNTTGNVVIGSGEGTGAVTGNTLRAPNATGTNIAGVDFTIAGGNGTGTGGGGDVVFQTSPIGASGTTANTLTERMRINYAGNVIIGTGDGTGTVTGNTLRGPNPIGTNIAGVDFTIAGGGGTGTGGGGDVVFQTAPAAATGATANTLTERMRIMYTGNVGIGTAAPSTLLQVNGTASLGTPSSNTGTLQFDNNTNANTVSISAGATSTSYSLTLPTAAPASNGQVLSSTTAGVMSWSSPSGQLKGIICDTTAGATVATLAAGTTMIVVKVVGGGGAGGGIGLSGTIYEDQTGSGGGAGAYCEGYLSGITVGTSTVTMTVGAGATGAGGNNGTVATSGGSSTVVVTSPAATFTAGGGKGGTTAEENTGGSSINQAGGSGGTASGGSINIPGSNGGSAIISITGNDVVFAGEGASSIFGNGGQQQYTRDDIAYTGLTAHAPGAGGGGAVAVQQSSNTNTKGGSGEHGIIIIYEY